MTHTSTEQPEDLKLADMLEKDVWQVTPMRLAKIVELSAETIRRLHARVQELEAYQARVPLSADEIKEPKNGEAWRVEWWNESLRMMLPSDKVLHRFNAYRNGTIQFTLKARAHNITQEKQG